MAAFGVHVKKGGGGNGLEMDGGLEHESVDLASEVGEGGARGQDGREVMGSKRAAAAEREEKGGDGVVGVEIRGKILLRRFAERVAGGEASPGRTN